MHKLKVFFYLLARAYADLKRNDPLRLAAATAFFTTFALPPILIILIQFFGAILNVENLGDAFFERFATILGKESSAQIRRTFLGFKSLASNWWITAGGTLFLLFVATTLFKVIKDSLNQLWSIRLSTKILKVTLQKRAASMLVILLAGILFIAATLSEGLEALLGEQLEDLIAGNSHFINMAIHKTVAVIAVTIWFAALFKLLPDARASWPVVIKGGLFTAVLFTLGKAILGYLLAFGNLSTVFGASTAIVLFLLFVFYSSMMMYFGACFTNAYANYSNDPILPGDHAIKYRLAEVDAMEEMEIKKEAREARRMIDEN